MGFLVPTPAPSGARSPSASTFAHWPARPPVRSSHTTHIVPVNRRSAEDPARDPRGLRPRAPPCQDPVLTWVACGPEAARPRLPCPHTLFPPPNKPERAGPTGCEGNWHKGRAPRVAGSGHGESGKAPGTGSETAPAFPWLPFPSSAPWTGESEPAREKTMWFYPLG
jgi:hypothetical protein